MFADSTFPAVGPQSNDVPASDLYTGVIGPYISTEVIARVAIPRHGSRPASAAPRNFDIRQRLPGMIDMVLFDGHVDKVPLENLWNYQWSADWQVPKQRPR